MRAWSTLVMASLLVGCDGGKGEDTGGDGAPPLTQNDRDGDGLVAAEDCDDEDASVGGPTAWYRDRDDDRYGDPDNPYETLECDEPSGYVSDDTDCDDVDAEVYPTAFESCDEKDNDCDGLVDDEDDEVHEAPTWYHDEDGDGYGDPSASVDACIAPSGAIERADDCDDTDATINPDGVETCNWTDDDCDDEIDEGLDTSTWYYDADGDGWGTDDTTVVDCDSPAEEWVADGGDCDDDDTAISPGATETCNSTDDDCDGDTDEDDADDAPVWYADDDGDGYGDPRDTRHACEQPTGHVDNDDDCDDRSATNNPEGAEVCDGDDNDCDGTTDEDDAEGAPTWYADGDGDGYGDEDDTTVACDQPAGYGAAYGDCDDGDDEVYPGAHEVCGDGTDSDCDGADGSCGEIDLADADAKLLGEAANDKAGVSIAGSGDVDGDGKDDIAAGARTADGAASDSGKAYLVTATPKGTLSLSAADASVAGDAKDDYLGASVAIVGDVDKDGFADVLVGAPQQDGGGTDAGAAYLFLGPMSGSYPASGADAVLTAESAGDYGGEVAPAGDTDGDGYADFLIGAYGEDTSAAEAGSAYLLLGPVSTDLDLSLANAQLIGEDAGDWAGFRVAGAGDTDADGYDDVLVSALYEDTGAADAGAVYLLNGPIRRSKYLSSADARLTGEAADDAAGRSAQGAGDIDGDGVDDVIVGAPYEDSAQSDGGAAYILAGPIAGTVSLASARAKLVGESDDDALGIAVAGLGDLDLDGFDDVVMGAHQEDAGGASAGAAYVVYGPISGTVDLFDTDHKLIGEAAGDAAGVTVAGAGDVDGDGLPDLLVGATGEDSGGSAAGAVYLLLGKSL